SYLTQIEFSPDGSRLLTIGSEGARMWDVVQGHEIPGLQVPDVDRATVRPNGTRLAMQQGTNVLVFDATGRRLFPPLRPDNFTVTGLAFASGGRLLGFCHAAGVSHE